YSREVFDGLRASFWRFAGRLGFDEIRFIPISALYGDMVVERGERLQWYSGATLLETLETVPSTGTPPEAPLRFPVQLVTRTGGNGAGGWRGYMGRIESGSLSEGQSVIVLPAGLRTHVRSILAFEGRMASAHAGQSVTLTLADEFDIS